jgi:hypothetical protein
MITGWSSNRPAPRYRVRSSSVIEVIVWARPSSYGHNARTENASSRWVRANWARPQMVAAWTAARPREAIGIHRATDRAVTMCLPGEEPRWEDPVVKGGQRGAQGRDGSARLAGRCGLRRLAVRRGIHPLGDRGRAADERVVGRGDGHDAPAATTQQRARECPSWRPAHGSSGKGGCVHGSCSFRLRNVASDSISWWIAVFIALVNGMS